MFSYHPDFAHRAWPIVFLSASCLSSIFTDFNNVPLLAVAWPSFFLCFCCSITRWRFIALSLVPLSMFRAVGAADYFHGYLSGPASWALGVAFSFIFSVIISSAAVVQMQIWKQWPELAISPLVFPTVLTGISQLWFRFSPVGAAGNIAMGLAFQPTLRQTAALGGEISLVFLVGWVCSIAAGLLIGRVSKRHLYSAISVGTFLLIFGGIRVGTGRGMWLQDISTWPASTTTRDLIPGVSGSYDHTPRSLQISCLTRGHGRYTNDIFERTSERLRQGDDIIMWSETAGGSYGDGPGGLAAEAVSRSFNWTGAAHGQIVGAAYLATTPSGNVYNSISILQATAGENGEVKPAVMSTYHKNRPVPLMEASISPGKGPPAVVEITTTRNATLKVASAICFDFDFPDVLQHASGADLVVGPSNYWASLGWDLWGDNMYRAVENGFTLYKCANNGISGGADPYGRNLAAKPTVQGVDFVTQIPVQKRVWTLYADGGGWLFGWLCVACTPLYALFAIFASRLRAAGHEIPRFLCCDELKVVRAPDMWSGNSPHDDRNTALLVNAAGSAAY